MLISVGNSERHGRYGRDIVHRIFWSCSHADHTGQRSNVGRCYLVVEQGMERISCSSNMIGHVEPHGCALEQQPASLGAISSHFLIKRMGDVVQEQTASAVLVWQGTTRASDGQRFGLGGEVGIATDSAIYFRGCHDKWWMLMMKGPVGTKAFKTTQWIVEPLT